MMVAAAAVRAGKCGSHGQDGHGYNYVWHEVMRGLEKDPQTEQRSQLPNTRFKEAAMTTAWLSRTSRRPRSH